MTALSTMNSTEPPSASGRAKSSVSPRDRVRTKSVTPSMTAMSTNTTTVMTINRVWETNRL